MNDDDLDMSEYYRDAQSFRALRKRKSKTDSTAGSGESCSKQKKAVDLLPVVLESKTGRELKAYSPVFIHNCVKVYRLVQELLSVDKWQSDCEMLHCAADDYTSTMHEADRW